MDEAKHYKFLNQDINKLVGVGSKIKNLLKKKKIEKISDLIWSFPHSFVDRSNLTNLDVLEIGKVTTIKVKVIKYNIPRIKNLPNKVLCKDEKGQIDIIFFNSREGYIRKMLPINEWVIISGKVNFYKNKYQIVNPSYVVPVSKENYVKKIIPKYSLTEGINEKTYRRIIEQVLNKIPNLVEWHSPDILKKIGEKSWKDCMLKLHNPNKKLDLNSDYYKRLAYDEILANLLVLSKIRSRIRKIKKKSKFFNHSLSKNLVSNFNFTLTNDQKKIINEINTDLKSENKMFRLLQGDVGSGKTIISLIAASNVIESNYQVAFMAPTEILARQHYNLAKNIFRGTKVNIGFLVGNTKSLIKKKILNNLINGKIDLLIGTHALFQKHIFYNNLGLIIIDEQHKFGVKQRMKLADKGGDNCDVLVMSATPIPRTLMLTFYGDMDVSKLIEKPSNRKEIITLSKPENKIKEILFFLRKQILLGNQIFWICPLIEESKKLDYAAVIKRHDYLNKYFLNKAGLIHGNLEQSKREKILQKFLKGSLDILVSTTIIEVGIDFPKANVIVIENSDKFGLSQLHQLRGRIGRGKSQGTCILIYKSNLSENAKKRIKILKSSNDGFIIAEKDMKIRGFGDILGFQQSGIKDFKVADPIQHEKLFKMAEENIKKIENTEQDLKKYELLLKLHDNAEIINEISS
tara:strand:- start:1292 stop:3355 length:2064 start_codon:yes stop_codon:yes gene_type:complete